MASRLFAHGIYEQSKSMVILKWIILPLLIVHVVLAQWLRTPPPTVREIPVVIEK